MHVAGVGVNLYGSWLSRITLDNLAQYPISFQFVCYMIVQWSMLRKLIVVLLFMLVGRY